MNEVLESHRKERQCENPKCVNQKQVEETTRFTCWYCGAVLEEIK